MVEFVTHSPISELSKVLNLHRKLILVYLSFLHVQKQLTNSTYCFFKVFYCIFHEGYISTTSTNNHCLDTFHRKTPQICTAHERIYPFSEELVPLCTQSINPENSLFQKIYSVAATNVVDVANFLSWCETLPAVFKVSMQRTHLQGHKNSTNHCHWRIAFDASDSEMQLSVATIFRESKTFISISQTLSSHTSSKFTS